MRILSAISLSSFCVDVFFPLSLPRLLLDLTVYMSITAGTPYHRQTPSRVHPDLFGKVRVAHLSFVRLGVFTF
jgi:hypothetical protein